MRSPHLPRRLVVLLLILLAALFISGNVLAFSGFHSPPAAELAPTGTTVPPASTAGTSTPFEHSADTTGILLLGILLVAIILVGLLWGSRLTRR